MKAKDADTCRHVRARGTHLPSTRTTSASGGNFLLALRAAIFIDVDGLDAAVALDVALERGEGGGGRRGCRSGRSAAGPSPPVRGPSARSRAPLAAAIWRRAVLARATVR